MPLTQGVEKNMLTDPILKALVNLAETEGTSITITLWVNGLVISGKVISHTEYQVAMADLVAALVFTMPQGLETLGQEKREKIQAALTSEVSHPDSDEVTYIHLSDVQQHVGATRLEFSNICWRGRIASVDGFFLGSIVPPKQAQSWA